MSTNSKPMDVAWRQIPGKTGPTMTLVKRCAQNAGLYAMLNTVLFIWQQMGLLDSTAAVPAMWVCALLAGFEIGKCVARGVR